MGLTGRRGGGWGYNQNKGENDTLVSKRFFEKRLGEIRAGKIHHNKIIYCH